MVNASVVGARIFDNFNFLKKLARTKSEKKRKRLIKLADPNELLAVVEICANIIRSPSFNLRTRQKNRLLPHATYIRKVAKVRSEKGARRIIMRGSGGPALAAILAPIVAEVTRVLFSKLPDLKTEKTNKSE